MNEIENIPMALTNNNIYQVAHLLIKDLIIVKKIIN